MSGRAVAALGLWLAGCDAMPGVVCGVAGEVATIDLDGDGRPEVRVVSVGGRELCRELDFGADGQADQVRVSLPEVGALWVASDLDFDGRADRIVVLPDAEVPVEILDLDHDGRADAVRRGASRRADDLSSGTGEARPR